MKNRILQILACVFIVGCVASQYAMYRPQGSDEQWNITASRDAMSSTISVSINDSLIVEDYPALFSTSFEAKGKYQGKEVKYHAVYNNGFLGIGAGWETTIFVDNEMAARFRL